MEVLDSSSIKVYEGAVPNASAASSCKWFLSNLKSVRVSRASFTIMVFKVYHKWDTMYYEEKRKKVSFLV